MFDADYSAPVWLSFALVGLLLGMSVRPQSLLRAWVGLFGLSVLGTLIANAAGQEGVAYWFGAATVAVTLVFALAVVGTWLCKAFRPRTRRAQPARKRLEDGLL